MTRMEKPQHAQHPQLTTPNEVIEFYSEYSRVILQQQNLKPTIAGKKKNRNYIRNRDIIFALAYPIAFKTAQN